MTPHIHCHNISNLTNVFKKRRFLLSEFKSHLILYEIIFVKTFASHNSYLLFTEIYFHVSTSKKNTWAPVVTN